MTPKSAKAKGRMLAQWVKRILLTCAGRVGLGDDDIVVTSSGTTGEDIQLSPTARSVYPLKIECKSREQIAVYKYYDQARSHAGEYIPVVVIKQNKREPLVVVDARHFFILVTHAQENNNNADSIQGTDTGGGGGV